MLVTRLSCLPPLLQYFESLTQNKSDSFPLTFLICILIWDLEQPTNSNFQISNSTYIFILGKPYFKAYCIIGKTSPAYELSTRTEI